MKAEIAQQDNKSPNWNLKHIAFLYFFPTSLCETYVDIGLFSGLPHHVVLSMNANFQGHTLSPGLKWIASVNLTFDSVCPIT
jgi:hypothetical protein